MCIYINLYTFFQQIVPIIYRSWNILEIVNLQWITFNNSHLNLLFQLNCVSRLRNNRRAIYWGKMYKKILLEYKDSVDRKRHISLLMYLYIGCFIYYFKRLNQAQIKSLFTCNLNMQFKKSCIKLFYICRIYRSILYIVCDMSLFFFNCVIRT